MSAVCDVTGTRPSFGNAVSHSHRRTRRRWNPNVQRRRLWLPGEGRHIRLNVSTTGLKVIDRDGIEAVVARIAQVRPGAAPARRVPGGTLTWQN